MRARKKINATKVVREVYDAEEGTSEESTIYKSPTLKERQRDRADTSGGGGGGGRRRRSGWWWFTPCLDGHRRKNPSGRRC